jgi:hypothetical protein
MRLAQFSAPIPPAGGAGDETVADPTKGRARSSEKQHDVAGMSQSEQPIAVADGRNGGVACSKNACRPYADPLRGSQLDSIFH